MGKSKNKGRLVVFLILAGLLLTSNLGVLRAAGPSDPSAIFYLSPSTSSVTQGSNLSIELRIKVTNDSTHSARARLTYSSDKMELVSVTPASSFFVADKKYETGVINIAYGSFPGVSGDQPFAAINFKINAASGDANVLIDPIIDADSHSYVAGDSSGTGENILTSVSNGTYSITKANESSQTTPSSTQTGQSQVKKPLSTAPTNNKKETGTSTNDNASAEAESIKTIVSGAGTASEDITSARSGVMDKIVVFLALPALVLAAFAARAINRRYRGSRRFIFRIRRRRLTTGRHETVADIAARVNRAHLDSANETVAEIAARINRSRPDTKSETVAELAARLRRKAKRKHLRRHPSRRHRKH